MNHELWLPPARVNPINNRFQKGHVPANKGKKWDEYMPKQSQRRAAKGWVNVVKYRPKKRSDVAGRARKKVVVVTDDGKFRIFSYLKEASDWLGRNHDNVGRCCRANMSKKVCKHNWRQGQPKGADLVNTDHKYMGYRWYYYDDPVWWDKVGNNDKPEVLPEKEHGDLLYIP